MATRRAKPYFFDHGTQFFKARSTEFKQFLAPLIIDGIIKPWHAHIHFCTQILIFAWVLMTLVVDFELEWTLTTLFLDFYFGVDSHDDGSKF